MYDDISAEIERVLDIGAEEGVVDYDHDSMLVGLRCNGSDIDESECRIGGCFNPDELRLLRDVLTHVDFNFGRKRNLDSMRFGNLCEVSVCPPVHIRHGNDV